MGDVLEGPRLKVVRANRGLQELNALLAAFRNENPYELVDYEDAATGDRIRQLRLYSDPPATLGIVVGEIVHNLRSALDHLACAVPLKPFAVRPPRPNFPVFLPQPDSSQPPRKSFDDKYMRCIGDAMPTLYDVIEAVQPYNPTGDVGFHPLGLLEALWNWDKHNAIAVVIASLGIRNTPPGTPEGTFAAPGPVKDGQVLVRLPVAGLVLQSDSPEPMPDIHLVIEAAFGWDGPGAGLPLMPTMLRIYEYVGRVVMPPLERIIAEAR